MGFARFIYALAWVVILPWVALSLLFKAKHRAGLAYRLGHWPKTLEKVISERPERRRVWLHAVSVGEVNSLRLLIQKLTEAGMGVFLTSTTQTGVQIAQGIAAANPLVIATYCPLDAPWLIAGLLNRVKPAALLIAETELWPGMIWESVARQIPVRLINGRLSERSFKGYHLFRALLSPILNRFDCLMMQTPADADRMIGLGAKPDRVTVMGNLKLEVKPAFQQHLQAAWASWLSADKTIKPPVITLASTQRGEDALLLEAVRPLFTDYPNLKVILAPRHPERTEEVSALLAAQSLTCVRRSALCLETPHAVAAPVILLDGVGELTTVYTLSTLAVIGGSWLLKDGRGGQSPVEPLSVGCVPIFGPDMRNFKAIVHDILAHKAGIQLKSASELTKILTHLLENPVQRKAMADRGEAWIAANQGASDRVMATLSFS